VGDAVRPVVALELKELEDVYGKAFNQAIPGRSKKNVTRDGHTFLDGYLGIYLGPKYRQMRDRRGDAGWVHRLFHCFLFGGVEVMIDPQHIELVAVEQAEANTDDQADTLDHKED